MDLEQHLDRLAALLDQERAAGKERFARLTLAERAARGLALLDVEAIGEGGLAGGPLVTDGPPDGRELGGAEISVGGIVRVSPKREPAPDAPTGLVARRRRDRVSLAFDEPPPEWATEGRVVLELQPSSATHDRLSGAVRRMREARRWQGVRRGQAPR